MSLIEHGWRQFTFFDKIPVHDPKQPKQPLSLKLNISFWANGEDYVLLGSADGAILQLTRNLDYQLWKSFGEKLFGFHLSGNLLASIGENEPGSSSTPILKLWELGHPWERSVPFCKFSNRVTVTKKTVAAYSPAAVVAINSAHSLIAIGFADSSVFYCSGDFSKEKIGSLKYKSLREGVSALGGGKLVGLVIATSAASHSAVELSVVFVITDSSLTSYVLEAGSVTRTILHDAKGCDRNCWYFSTTKNQLIIAGREMVNFYDVEGCLETDSEKGRCFALARGGEKLQLVAFGNHIALLTQQKALSNSESGPIILSVYDVEFRYIAFLCSIKVPCQLFTLGDEIFVLDTNGDLSRLVEKSLNLKLEFLLKKNLFDVAIGLGRRHKSKDLHNIYKEYGDYLYGRGDFDNSIRQYTATIGEIEPSYVIRKFLDGSRIVQLCTYLESMHQKGLAEKQHTNLLLGAYIKINAKDKIAEFVEKSATASTYNGFDVESTVKILRSTQFAKIAARLAVLHKHSSLFLSVLIDDLKEYDNAIKYLETLSTPEVCEYLEAYANVLMENEEASVVKLISKIALSKDANLRQLVKVVMRKPEHLESIFGGDFRTEDVFVRNAILEQRLHCFTTKLKTTDEERQSILSLVNADNFNEALHLGELHKFPPLIIDVLKRQNRWEDLLRYLLKEGDINDVVRYCGEDALKKMWIELINFVATKKEINSQYVISLMEKAIETNFIDPLVILEILSRSEVFRVGDVKEYILKWLRQQNKLIKDDELEIETNERSIAEMDSQIDDLENNIQTFQMNKCTHCEFPLSFSTVHFLCKHAYHLHCYEDNAGQSEQCPLCARLNRSKPSASTVKDKGRREMYPVILHREFRTELEESNGAISLIAQYIGQGVFDKEDETPNSVPKVSSMV